MEQLNKFKFLKRYPVKTVVTLLICGYLVGVAFTIFFVLYSSNQSLEDLSQWISIVLLVLLCYILLYSRTVRCTITLAIPILFSSKGRSLVMAFAFFLAATGPTWNILRNVDVLTTSMTCGQVQLNEALSNMIDVMKQPLAAVKDMISTAMDEIRNVMAKVEVVLFRIQELILILVASIKNAFDWLANIVSMCNKEFGTPFDRCMKIADNAMEDCRIKMGPIKNICKLTHFFSMLCYSAKVVDVLCVLVVFFNDAVVEKIMTGLTHFKREVKNLFDVSITFDHDFYFKTMVSKEISEVTADIMVDIHARMKTLILLFGYLDVIGGFLAVTVIIKAVYFRLRFIHSKTYANKYITREFIDIDEARKRNEQEVVLPLTFFERTRYVELTDCRMTRTELRQIVQSILFLMISCIQLFCICFIDYSLFWLLALISYYGHKQAGLEVPPFITVEVRGSGFVADIFKGIVHAFEPLSMNSTIDTKPCLPVPKPPSYRRYFEIGALAVLAWMLSICQPYGLRLRHVIMRYYYPEVAHARALWLYNDILMQRIDFFKFARRKARSKLFHDKSFDDFSFLDWIRAKTRRFWIFPCTLGLFQGEVCVICSTPLKEDKVKCDTLGCKGLFCQNCYKQSNNLCCICNNPIDYGDRSDVSEVLDSSDDLNEVRVHESDKYCAKDRTQPSHNK